MSGGVDTDSRLIEPGGIFVAKPGEETDGHLFVDAAVAGGAALAHRRARGRRPTSRRSSSRTRSPPSPTSRAMSSRRVRASGRPPHRRDHRIQRQDHDQEPARPDPRGRGRDRRAARLVQQRGRRAAHDAARHGRHAVPRERVRRERTRRDRPPRRARRARRRRRADGRHGARRRLRRDRGDVRGEVGARSGGAPRRSRGAERRRRARRGDGARSRPSAASRCAGSGAARRADVRADDVEVTADGTRCHGHGVDGHVRCRCICACSASTTS